MFRWLLQWLNKFLQSPFDSLGIVTKFDLCGVAINIFTWVYLVF